MSHVLHRTNNILQYNTHFWKAIDIKVYSKSFSQHRCEQCSFAHHEILRNSKNITYIDRSAAFLMVLSWEIFIRMSEFPTFLWNFLKFFQKIMRIWHKNMRKAGDWSHNAKSFLIMHTNDWGQHYLYFQALNCMNLKDLLLPIQKYFNNAMCFFFAQRD